MAREDEERKKDILAAPEEEPRDCENCEYNDGLYCTHGGC